MLARARWPRSRASRRCVLVDEGAPSDVDEVGARLHGRHHACVDQPSGGVGERRHQHHVVGIVDQCLDVGDHLHAGKGARSIVAAQRPHLRTEGSQPLGDGQPDPAEPQEAHPASVEGAEGLRRHVPVRRRTIDPRVGEVLLEGQHRGQHPLGDGHGAHAPRVGEEQLGAHQVERELVDAGADEVDPPHAPGEHVGEVRHHVGTADEHLPGEPRFELALRGDGNTRTCSAISGGRAKRSTSPTWLSTVSTTLDPTADGVRSLTSSPADAVSMSNANR